VVVDGQGRTPPSAQIFTETGKVVVTISKSVKPEKKAELIKAGAELLELPDKDGPLDLKELLRMLAERDIISVLVEGGGVLLGSLFDAKLVDKVVAFIAPVIIGGENAKTPVAGQGVDKVVDAIQLKQVNVERFGDDLMIIGYPGE
jgi:diaminohydroxyphosphoribosylaminopyrimidine deaminase/5-amino-6-(5-phosphoribosylamino)uracil reductase